MSSTEKELLLCSIGIIIHNEEKNIGKLLESLLTQKLSRVRIKEIIVVSSASTDNSDNIVKSFSQKDMRVKLVTEPERKGKSAAINTFLSSIKEEIVVITSGDVIPTPETIELLVSPFGDKKVGMTGCRPVPVDKEDSFVGYWVNLQWRLHHYISLESPKLGEMIAFRRVFTKVPEDSAVDEASIEQIIKSKELILKYVPEAIVYNKGPNTVRDFLKQRKRIASGHLWLKHNTTYKVSTNSPSLLVKALFKEIKQRPQRVFFIDLIILLEIWARIMGWIDLNIKKKNPYKWDVINSTKNVDGDQ